MMLVLRKLAGRERQRKDVSEWKDCKSQHVLCKEWNKKIENGRGTLLYYQFPEYSGCGCPVHHCIPNA